jgi:hypothetical protein
MTVDLRIEKARFPVSLLMSGGERLNGDMFVQAYSRFHTGREEIPDVLNGDEPFFPLVRAGDTLLIAKGQVREVEVSWEPDSVELHAVGIRAESVELTLTDGTVRTGELHLEMPSERPRLLDFLNQYGRRFVVLHAIAGLRLVNCGLIERVRPVE